jgi:cytosine/adenosine deaminase-related metal-dependent hydrolase
MPESSLSLTARYVLPVEGEPIANGLVSIRDGRIEEVGPADGRAADLDLGNVAILPGFVNAHTHLELDPLPGGDGNGTVDSIGWLWRVIQQRRGRTSAALQEAALRNLDAAIRAGTTLVADTTTDGLSWESIVRAPVRGVIFSEVIGLRRERGLETSHRAWEWISSIRPEDQVVGNARPGLSPHAPYSTAGWLYYRAAGSRLPLSTHLAEFPEELELLASRTGRLRTFLEDLSAWDQEWDPIGPRPADYVRRGDLRLADWLIAHGNYLDPSDFWQLRPEAAPGDQRVAVAYCPRTHARFGLAPHPYRDMLKQGVVVCLGTDSRASAPTLSILDEMRFLYRNDPTRNGALILTMGTLFGAWALRAETVTGSLKSGKSADLAVVALPDRDGDGDPYRLLFESELPVLATAFEGRFVTGPWRR